MSSVPFRERPEFLRGRAAELLVAAWLQEHGWYVIPSYDYAGTDGNKPPRLQGRTAGHAVPDLDISKRGKQRCWVEVKSKLRPNIWHRARDWGYPEVLEHGIENYQHYLAVKRITGDEVWLAIYEECSGELLMAEIDALGKPRMGMQDGKPIANWPRGFFKLVHRFGLDGVA